jgi:hypothetical protein
MVDRGIAVHDWHGEWICRDCAENLPELLQPYPQLLPDYHFLSSSVLNLPLCYIAQVDPVHIPA